MTVSATASAVASRNTHGSSSISTVSGDFSAALQQAASGETQTGDLNGDGSVDNDDLNWLALALTDPDAFATQFPQVDMTKAADLNRDNAVDNEDIAALSEVILHAQPVAPTNQAPARALPAALELPPVFQVGDLDANGAVDNEELLAYAQALVDPAALPSVDADLVGDLNGDGALDNEDIAHLPELLLSNEPTYGLTAEGRAATEAYISGLNELEASTQPSADKLAAQYSLTQQFAALMGGLEPARRALSTLLENLTLGAA
jgi:hypothetical protein